MRSSFNITLLILLFVLTTAGCSTTPGGLSGSKIQVSVSSFGRITVDGRSVELSRLAGRLRSMGAGPGTRILISVPKDIYNSTIMDISRTLSAAGYRKVLFVKPKQVKTSKGKNP